MAWLRKEERTEPATPKRREEARKKGQVAKTKELPCALVVFASAIFFYFYGEIFVRELGEFTSFVFTHLGPGCMNHLKMLKSPISHTLASVMLPFLVFITATAVIGNYLQTGWVFSLDPIAPKFSRINPLTGLQRLFSPTALVELTKALFKLLVIGYVTYKIIESHLAKLSSLSAFSLGYIGGYTSKVGLELLLKLGIILMVLSVFDYIYQRYEFEGSIRMTKEEVKEEYRMHEGDPRVKSRIRSLQRALARTRMMEAVKKADVVITNPVHLAVALKYEPQRHHAPEVVAKGAGYIAEKIKEIARRYDIPVMENKPLAQALFKLEVGEIIPPVLFKAVAEILAYVYRIKGKGISA